MSNTPNLGLPLLQAAQAQKHVTVNEALVLLDGACQLVLVSVSTSIPPTLANEGDCYGVPVGATNEWASNTGDIAIRSNGGWVFITPALGWRGWISDLGGSALFDGVSWVNGAVAMSVHGAATIHEVLEVEQTIGAGITQLIVGALPAQSMVTGVTGRVLSTITGTLSDWKLGVAAADNRYGSGLGLSSGSWVRALTSAPQTYYSDTDLLLSAVGGDFAGGTVRMAIHLVRLTIPSN